MIANSVFFVKSTPLRAFIGSFWHFADIYFSKTVCISVCGGISSKSYLLPSFILNTKIHKTCSHNGFLTQSICHSENTKIKLITVMKQVLLNINVVVDATNHSKVVSWCYSYFVCFLVFTTRHFRLSLALLFVLVFLCLLPLGLGDILFLPESSVQPSKLCPLCN